STGRSSPCRSRAFRSSLCLWARVSLPPPSRRERKPGIFAVYAREPPPARYTGSGLEPEAGRSASRLPLQVGRTSGADVHVCRVADPAATCGHADRISEDLQQTRADVESRVSARAGSQVERIGR